jgi:hypothetical protein
MSVPNLAVAVVLRKTGRHTCQTSRKIYLKPTVQSMYFVNHILEWIHLLLRNVKTRAQGPRLMLVDVSVTSRKSVPGVRVEGPQ